MENLKKLRLVNLSGNGLTGDISKILTIFNEIRNPGYIPTIIIDRMCSGSEYASSAELYKDQKALVKSATRR